MNKKLAFFAGACVATLSACATSSTGRSQLLLMPAAQLNQMGFQAFDELKKKEKISKDRRVNNYVSCVSNQIIRHLPAEQAQQEWEVVVFDNDAVNAFALPGGKIGVYTGLLKAARNQHQLAAVIGHEIVHVQEQHANERVSQSQLASVGLQAAAVFADAKQVAYKNEIMGLLGVGLQVGVLLPFGRAQESESDVIGLDLMARAGFDPRQSVNLWQNMAAESEGKAPPEFLSTHPAHDTRINQLQEQMPKALQYYQQARNQGQTPNCRR